MVCDFARTHLKYDAVRLRDLMFTGLRFVVIETEEFEKMLQLAENVDWTMEYMAWAANVDALEAHSVNF